ncbi:hypothetical protein TRL7639_00053 [Falsiruegeria litorea R37]|uniref:Uncharacterized protein n=1 Tax=Falsiruegeria litorea R37 TaxID=1200284 RepID=A0A1Y5R8R3_9RHOB|nr:hypothetical protein [Falsiruegeria litorea]SLN11038.1 hypothetical protein TRL7639_00053 [Falsiruegeria litorea R37]
MLTVVVYVNETPVARALVGNMSDLADVSDYKVRVVEHGAPDLDIPASDVTGWIKDHPRRTSVWHLVRKIAEMATSEHSGSRVGTE